MSLFDKLKDKTKETYDKLKARNERKKVLNDLTKTQLYDLAVDYGVPLSKSMDKEEMVSKLSKCDDLSIKTIMQRASKSYKKSMKTTRKRKTEDLEVEQEIVRTERIRTKVTKRKEISYDSVVYKVLQKFDPIVKRNTKERNLEAQLVQALRMTVGSENVDYQQRAKSGRLDIVVGKDVGIELKLVSSPSQFASLQGQLFNYAQEFEKIYCWLYDCNKSIKLRDLNLFKDNLKKMGLDNVKVIMRP